MRYSIASREDLLTALAREAASSHYACVLSTSGSANDDYGDWEVLAGFANEQTPTATHWQATQYLLDHPNEHNWWLGGLTYELKDSLFSQLPPTPPPPVPLPPTVLFRAQRVAGLRRGATEVELWGGWRKSAARAFQQSYAPPAKHPCPQPPAFAPSFTQEAYLAAIQSIQRHIREGDVYEVNLAQCFATTCPQFKPTDYWLHLLQRQPVPFAALLRWGGVWALGASPERFLQLRGGQLVTQPIKGTAKRGPSPQADAELARQLALSEKERAENVMIVDLARNDLYRTCTPESVAVPGLFQVHTYPTLHQLVSTVTGTLAPHCTPSQALAAAFPPGSMTGAPKISAMQCIAQHEPYGRGLYAGSVGYVAPVAAGAGFDFNVVIRTLLYNTETHLLAYHVGGAITADSDPLAEYYETLTKAKALRQAFGFDLP